MRKQLGIKLPEELIAVIKRTSERQYRSVTNFVETAVRKELNELKVKIPSNRPIIYLTDEDLI